MGLIVFPVFRPPIPAVNPRTSGEFLGAEFAALDRIAQTSGTVPITAFADQRPVPDDFDGPPWELDEVLGPCEDWFSAVEGQVAFTKLARLIRERPQLAQELESPENVAEELDDLTRILSVAADAGSEFRLEMR